MSLRSDVVKLAHKHPELRAELLPLLKKGMEHATEEARKKQAVSWMEPGKYYELPDRHRSNDFLGQWFYAEEKQRNGSMKGYVVTWGIDDRGPRKAKKDRVDTTWAKDWAEAKENQLDPKVKAKFKQVV